MEAGLFLRILQFLVNITSKLRTEELKVLKDLLNCLINENSTFWSRPTS